MCCMSDVRPAQLCSNDSFGRDPLWLKYIYNKAAVGDASLNQTLSHSHSFSFTWILFF